MRVAPVTRLPPVNVSTGGGTEALPGRCGDGGDGNKDVFKRPTVFNFSLLQLPYLIFATLVLPPEAWPPRPSPFQHSQIYFHTTEDFLSQYLLPPVVDLDLVLSVSLCSPFSALFSSLLLLLLLSWLPFLNDWWPSSFAHGQFINGEGLGQSADLLSPFSLPSNLPPAVFLLSLSNTYALLIFSVFFPSAFASTWWRPCHIWRVPPLLPWVTQP